VLGWHKHLIKGRWLLEGMQKRLRKVIYWKRYFWGRDRLYLEKKSGLLEIETYSTQGEENTYAHA